MWLAFLTAVDERAILLKNKKCFTSLFTGLLKNNPSLKEKYNNLIISQCSENNLNDVLNYTFEKYSGIFEDALLPVGKGKEDYLADIIQFLCACDA